jgi:hypothetical protein
MKKQVTAVIALAALAFVGVSYLAQAEETAAPAAATEAAAPAADTTMTTAPAATEEQAKTEQQTDCEAVASAPKEDGTEPTAEEMDARMKDCMAQHAAAAPAATDAAPAADAAAPAADAPAPKATDE